MPLLSMPSMRSKSDTDSPVADGLKAGFGGVVGSGRVVVLSLLGVVLLAAVRAVNAGWSPRGDHAMTQLRVLDVGTSRTPLLGMPSTVTEVGVAPVHHPGPLQFWILSAPFRTVSAVSGSSASLVIAAAMGSIALLLISAWLVVRSVDRPSGVAAVAAYSAVVLLRAGSSMTNSPWNPDFALVALLAATAVGVAVLVGRPSLPAVIGVVVFASAAAQAHLSYVTPALALVVGVVWVWRRASARERRRRDLIVTVGCTVLVWLGPIIDVVTNGGGNVRLAATSESAQAGWGAAMSRLANSVTPWELGLIRPTDAVHYARPASWLAYLWLAALVVVVGGCVRSHRVLRPVAAVGGAMLLGLVVGTAVAPPSLATAYSAHVQRSWIIPTLLVWSIPALAGMRWLAHRPGPWFGRTNAVLAATPLLVFISTAALDRDQSAWVQPVCSTAVSDLADGAHDRFGGDLQVYDSRDVGFDTFGFAAQVTSGVYAELERRDGGAVVLGRVASGMIHPQRVAAVLQPGDDVVHDVVVTASEQPPDSNHRLIRLARGGDDCDSPGASSVVALWERNLEVVDE